MKNLSFLFVLTAIISTSNVICVKAIDTIRAEQQHEESAQSIWRKIKEFESYLAHQAAGFTLTGTWPEYDNNKRRKEELYDAMLYVENMCQDKNLRFLIDPQQTLLKPLVVSYIEVALKQNELAPREYFEAHNQEKHIEYINYLKTQKEHFNTIKYMQDKYDC